MSETGNNLPSDGDPGKPESQAPEEESRESEPDWKKLYLEHGKPAQEEANRLRRELEAREAARQSPAAERQPSPGVAWDKVRGFGETGNPDDPAVEVAKGLVVMGEALIQKERADLERSDLQDIEDRVVRKEVKAYLEDQRRQGRSIDVAAALDSVRASKLETERDVLKDALRRAEANRRDPEEKRITTPREVPASQMKPREMSKADFQAELEDLPMHEAIKRQQELAAGRIIFKK